MFYDFPITVPANTPADAPVTEVMELTSGVVHYVELEFPDGCGDMVHVRIGQPEATYLPTNPSGSFASDGHTIPITENLELGAGGTTLKAFCWSPGTVYPHTVTIRIGVLPVEVVQPVSLITGLISKVAQLIGVK